MTKRPAGAWRRFLAALAVLAGLLAGIPALLVACSTAALGSASPLPGVGTTAEIRAYFERGLTTTEIVPIAVRSLLVIGWLLWLALVVSSIAAIVEARTGSRGRWPRLTMFGGLTRWIAAGLTAVSTLSPNFVSAEATATRLPFTVSTLRPAAAALTASPIERPVAPGTARVLPGESAETFARRTLGDASRWTELWALNGNRPVGPDGEVWTAAWRLSAGWDLKLPAAAPASLPPDEPVPAPAAETPAGDAATYEVKAGDSYWSIAERRLGATAGAASVAELTTSLIARNAPELGYADPTMLHPGDVLAVEVASPATSATPSAPPSAERVHVVVAGDSYWSIAERTALDRLGPEEARAGVVYDLMLELIDRNAPRLGYDNPEMLHPGDEVWLGDSSVEPSTVPAAPTVLGAAPQPSAVTTLPPPSPPPPTTVAPTTTPTTTTTTPSATTTTTTTTVPVGAPTGDGGAPGDVDADRPRAPLPVGVGEVALLATGIVALLAARRRSRLRAAEPPARVPLPSARAAEAERSMRAVADADRLLRVDIAVRAAAASLIGAGTRITVVRSGVDGAVELCLADPSPLPEPWTALAGPTTVTSGEGTRWLLAGDVPVEELAAAARTVGAPCLALAAVGVDEQGGDVLVDVEALRLLTVDADAATADAILAGIAAALASSELAEVVHLIGVGIDERALLGHRLAQHVATLDEAMELAGTLVGSRAADTTGARSTFELRARRTGGEAWEPAVVLVGAGAAAELPASVLAEASEHPGFSFVVAAPEDPGHWTLRPGDGGWVLDPLGLRLRPVGLGREAMDAVAEILDVGPAAEPVAPGHELLMGPCDVEIADDPYGDADGDTADVAEGPSVTSAASAAAGLSGLGPLRIRRVDLADLQAHRSINGHASPAASPSSVPWQLMVRLLGPVDVVDRDGAVVGFERSKALELAAWLVTHRERSTRQAARTALWDLDVRDATFANVVSETRRSTARHVAPPEGDEWLRRTLTDELSLHEEVVADADVVRRATVAARGHDPAEVVERLHPALELIRGMPFEATSYLWPDAEGITSNLVLLATSATARYAEAALAAGDIEGVFWATGKGLNVLSGQETLIALRMRAYAAAGDISGVRNEWDAYERALHADPWSDGEAAPKLLSLRAELLGR